MPVQAADELRYARRVGIVVKQDQVENFLSQMRSDVFPTLKQQAGIRRMYLLRSPERRNEFVSLTLWNSKSEADSYGSSAYSKNTQTVSNFLESDPVLTEYDVEFHYVNSADLPPPKSAKQIVTRVIRRSKPKRRSSEARPKRSKKRSR